MATSVAVCSTLNGAPCCDPDRVGQAEGHARTRLLTVSGGRRLGVLRKFVGSRAAERPGGGS